MKKIFTLTSALALALCAAAQQKAPLTSQPQRANSPRVATETEIAAAHEMGHSSGQSVIYTSANRGGGVFSEDFSNGFDGQNGAWIIEDSGGGEIWMMANAQSPGGFYSDPSEALDSETAANGWVIFDADLYQGGEIIPGINDEEVVSGYLTSPSIDFSSMTSVIWEFQQAFRYCCADAKPLFLEVSNDGGFNWFVYDAAPDFAGGANDASVNPYVTAIDISGAAAGQSDVRVRFGFQPNGNASHTHYFWGIDDIIVYENPIQNDVSVLYVSNGDIFNDFEYRALALEQAIPEEDGGLVIGTVYENLGTVTQSATVLVEVLDADLETIASVSEALTIPSNSELLTPGDPIDTIFIASNWQPQTAGTYWVRTTISYGGTDDTPEDNTMMKRFLVVDGEYGHDDPELINSQMNPLAGGTAGVPFDPTGYGSYLSIVNDGSTAGGVSIRFDNSQDDFCPFNIQLLQQGEDYNLTDADFVGYEEYIVQPFYVPNGNNQFPVYLPYEETVDLEAGERYFVGIQTDGETDEELSVKAIAEPDADFSTGVWAETTEGDFIWFFGLAGINDFSPAIRLILYEFEGTGEIEKDYLTTFAVNPNPAVSEARINFQLANAGYVAYEVRDIQGKLIEFGNKGQFGTGNSTISLDVNTYAAGNYMVNLVIDGEKMFSRQMSVVKQ